jgi:hypothetical protein
VQSSEAYTFAEELGCIPGFPWGNAPAVAKVAEVIATLCRTAEDAERLVNAAAESMSKWEGIPALRAIYHASRADVDETWRGDYPCVSPDCSRCSDLGWVKDGARHIRCDCPAAAQVEDDELRRLDRAFGRTPEVRESKPNKPTPEEFNEVIRRAMARKVVSIQ